MRRVLLRIFAALQLTRMTTAFAAVASAWFIVLWTHGRREEVGTVAFFEYPLLALLIGAAMNALGLFGFATALNDVLDFRRDQSLHPERPLPSGRVSLDGAITLVVGSLVVAVLGATVLGMTSVVLTLLVAGAILFLNATGKFIPGIGLLVLGLIYAGQMVVPNLHLRFVTPVWWVMTHALAVAGLAHMLGRRAPGLSPRATLFAISGWVFWSVVMFVFGWWRNRESIGGAGQGDSGGHGVMARMLDALGAAIWPEWVSSGPGQARLAGVAVGLLALLYAILVWRRLGTLGRGPRVAEKIARYGALWLPLYAAAWFFFMGDPRAGGIMTALAVLGLLGMTLLREVVALLEHPLGYRQ